MPLPQGPDATGRRPAGRPTSRLALAGRHLPAHGVVGEAPAWREGRLEPAEPQAGLEGGGEPHPLAPQEGQAAGQQQQADG
ncbi:hypothetical protein B7486_54045, partial [cyanobacterium TDX16]